MSETYEITMVGGDVLTYEWTGSVWQAGAYQTGDERDVQIFVARQYLEACGEHGLTDEQVYEQIEE